VRQPDAITGFSSPGQGLRIRLQSKLIEGGKRHKKDASQKTLSLVLSPFTKLTLSFNCPLPGSVILLPNVSNTVMIRYIASSMAFFSKIFRPPSKNGHFTQHRAAF
jgi:hypothetical protein